MSAAIIDDEYCSTRPRCMMTAPVAINPVSSAAIQPVVPAGTIARPNMNPAVPAPANSSHVGTFLTENEETRRFGSPPDDNAERAGPDGTRAGGGCCAW